jgi:hypothetical protein
MARIHRADSPACSCGAEAFYSTARCGVALDKNCNKCLAIDLSYALGGWSGRIERRTGRHVDGNRYRWKPEIIATKAVIQFVKATGRLQPQQGIEMEGEGGQRGSSG